MTKKKDKMNKVINKKNAFTLVEILVAMSIVVMLAVMMAGVLNAIGITNKGRDAQRKKDLNRIKIAFEEYFNDNDFYPDDVGTWNVKANCGKNISEFPNLKPWPCDPNGETYKIFTEATEFRVIANLENKKDKDIPEGWYEKGNFNIFGLGINQVNYGVSSTNILWYEIEVAPFCIATDCRVSEGGVGCDSVSFDIGCEGNDCYYHDGGDGRCNSLCKVSCCGLKCPQ